MPTYRYSAVSKDGKKVSAHLRYKAIDENIAKITLPSGTDISASALSRYTFHRKK